MAIESKDKELHRIAPTAIIYRPNRTYLIAQRALTKKAFPGKWNVPGGGVSVDDYINEAPTHGLQWYNAVEKTLRREVKEEVGLEIGKLEFLLDLTFIRPDGVPVLVLSYFGPYVSGEVIHDEDTIDSAWVTLEEASNYDLIDGTLEEIKMVDDILKTRM